MVLLHVWRTVGFKFMASALLLANICFTTASEFASQIYSGGNKIGSIALLGRALGNYGVRIEATPVLGQLLYQELEANSSGMRTAMFNDHIQ